MRNRPDLPTVLVVIGIVASLLFLATGSSILDLGTFSVLPLGLICVIFLYGVYWGLDVRQGLAVRLYRDQALGVSLVSLGIFSVFVVNIFSTMVFPDVPALASSTSFQTRFYLWILLTMFWIDTSMRASRDMDPLSRDSLHWSKVRYNVWGLNFLGIAVFALYLAATGNYALLDNTPSNAPQAVIGFVVNMPLFATFISGVIALPIGAIRSKDRSFRGQLLWFSLSLLSFFVFSVLAADAPDGSALQNGYYGLGFLLLGYCLYRSAHSLVPLNRMTAETSPQQS
jgi:hypothetical protein